MGTDYNNNIETLVKDGEYWAENSPCCMMKMSNYISNIMINNLYNIIVMLFGSFNHLSVLLFPLFCQ